LNSDDKGQTFGSLGFDGDRPIAAIFSFRFADGRTVTAPELIRDKEQFTDFFPDEDLAGGLRQCIASNFAIDLDDAYIGISPPVGVPDERGPEVHVFVRDQELTLPLTVERMRELFGTDYKLEMR